MNPYYIVVFVVITYFPIVILWEYCFPSSDENEQVFKCMMTAHGLSFTLCMSWVMLNASCFQCHIPNHAFRALVP